MRLAFFSPLNPAPSGISDYAEELLPALAARGGAEMDITLVVDGYTPSNPEITHRFRVVQDRDYDAREFELALYQLGNSPAHAYIYKRALVEPGLIVLHDLVLHHLVAWLTLNHGDRAGYVGAMREAYGERGAELAEREASGLEALNRFDYPLSERVIRAARGVIAHSRYVANAVEKIAPRVPVAIIPHEMPDLPLLEQREARAQLRLPQGTPLIGSFGNLGPTKRTTVLLDAFRSVRVKFPDARLLLAGAASPNFDVEGLLDVFGVREAVDVIGHVPFDEFHAYMAAVDVCVNLRYPTAGETSGAVLRMMAQARPVLVSRAGWFAELPDDAVAKIDVDDAETEMLRVILARLLEDAPLRAAMGANARRYVQQECALEDAAGAYVEFIRAVGGGPATLRPSGQAPDGVWATDEERGVRLRTRTADEALKYECGGRMPAESVTPDPASAGGIGDWRDEVTRAFVELGLEENDPVLREVAQAVTEMGLNE